VNETEKRHLVAQWAFDTRPVLARFHLWLEDVEVERVENERGELHTFAPDRIRRCLATASAVTALGTRLFGRYGEGAGQEKAVVNQVKKAADAISAYVMSEALWHLTRGLPENHAIMVSLGEGLMPKAGETPEMGANPLLGFGRVYARPQVAMFVDAQIRALLNEPGRTWDDFYEALRSEGITVWGAAVDTLENTSRFAKGADTGPMSVLHLFDQPLTVSRPYESYMGSLTVPRPVRQAAEDQSVLLNFLTPREKIVQAVEQAYPGVRRENIHVWTLRGKSRETRLSKLWQEWAATGAHLVQDDWTTPSGIPVFTESGTYAPTFLVGAWQDKTGDTQVFLCDGYAATAEAMQAASLSDVLDVDVSMALYSPTFELPHDREPLVMRLRSDDPAFAQQLGDVFGAPLPEHRVAYYRSVIKDAVVSNMPMGRGVLHADDFFPEKNWRVLSAIGYMCPDPYTGAPGVTRLDDERYEVTTRLATRRAVSEIRFVFRLLEPHDEARLVFNPLLVRFASGEDYTQRAVKVSDSGRIRNELQTMMSQALEYDGDKIRVHFDRLDGEVMLPEMQESVHSALGWYKKHHPAWFHWLELA